MDDITVDRFEVLGCMVCDLNSKECNFWDKILRRCIMYLCQDDFKNNPFEDLELRSDFITAISYSKLFNSVYKEENGIYDWNDSLYFACVEGYSMTAEYLIQNGVDVNHIKKVKYDHRLLIIRSPEILFTDTYMNGNTGIAQLLLDSGLKIDPYSLIGKQVNCTEKYMEMCKFVREYYSKSESYKSLIF